MCGRFTLRTPANLLVERFMLASKPAVQLRFNIAPTQEALVVRAVAGARQPTMMRWGLIPSWAKDPRIGASMINARSETVAEKPAFRTPFRRRRCLVLADGYYEWVRRGKAKIPHLYERRDEQPFALAGIWDEWQSSLSFAVLTTTANELAAPVHDRMPVILDDLDSTRWLDPATSTDDLQHILEPYPSDLLQVREVGPYVNNAWHEGPECVASLLF